jgi:chromosome partitioning protein
MEVIAIVNRKGGVGKTATAQALGAGLIKKGCSVLYIDLDSQTNLTYGLGADAGGLSSMDVLAGDATAQEAIQHTQQGDVIAGAEALAGADAAIDGTGKEYRLKEALEGLQYDYCIIDTPAALGTLTVNALTAADSVIIPVQAEVYSLQGIGQLSKTIETVKKYCNRNLYIRGILITRYNGRAIISRDMQSNLEDAAAQLKTRLYSTPIRECVSIKEAQASQQDIYSYAPRSNAAKDYADFLEEFMERKA